MVGIMGSRELGRNSPRAVDIVKEVCSNCSGIILSGGARGVDTLAKEFAGVFGLPFKEMPVEEFEWQALGKRSGHVRNRMMGVYLQEHGGCAIILPKVGAPNKGTGNMISVCKRMNVPHKVFWVEV